MDKLGVLFLLINSISYSISVIINRMGLVAGADPYTFALSVALLTGIISLFAAWRYRKEFKKMDTKDWIKVVSIGVIAGGICNYLWYYGQALTTATNVGFITVLIVPITAFWSWLLLKEKLELKKWIFIIIALLGSIVMSTGLKFTSFNLGDLFIFAAYVLLGLTFVIAKSLMAKLSGPFIGYWRMITGALFMLIVSLFIKKPIIVASQYWIYLIPTAILSVVLFIFYYLGLFRVKATVSTVIGQFGTVFIALLGWTFLGETLPLFNWAGGIVAVGAVLAFIFT